MNTFDLIKIWRGFGCGVSVRYDWEKEDKDNGGQAWTGWA